MRTTDPGVAYCMQISMYNLTLSHEINVRDLSANLYCNVVLIIILKLIQNILRNNTGNNYATIDFCVN